MAKKEKNAVATIDLGQVVPTPIPNSDIDLILEGETPVGTKNALNTNGLKYYHDNANAICPIPVHGYVMLDEQADITELYPGTTWEQLKGMFPRAAGDGDNIDPSISVNDGGVDSYEKIYGFGFGEYFGDNGMYAHTNPSMPAGDQIFLSYSDTGWQQHHAEMVDSQGSGFATNSGSQQGKICRNVNWARNVQSQTHQNRPVFKNVKMYRRLS